MDRRAEAIARLEEYRLLTAACENIAARLERQPPQSAEYKRLEADLSRNTLRTMEVDRAAAVLEQDQHRLLQLMYLERKRYSGVQICRMMGLSPSSMYRKRLKALNAFTVALFGCDGL